MIVEQASYHSTSLARVRETIDVVVQRVNLGPDLLGDIVLDCDYIPGCERRCQSRKGEGKKSIEKRPFVLRVHGRNALRLYTPGWHHSFFCQFGVWGRYSWRTPHTIKISYIAYCTMNFGPSFRVQATLNGARADPEVSLQYLTPRRSVYGNATTLHYNFE